MMSGGNRSRSARSLNSTRYVKGASQIVEYVLGRTRTAGRFVFQSLSDAFPSVGCRGDVSHTLIGLSVLDYDRCSSIDREDHGPAGFLEVTYEFRGLIAEGCHRLDVFGDVQGLASVGDYRIR